MGVGTDSILISKLALALGGGSEVDSVHGHVECRLIHACSFFFHVGQHVCTDWLLV